VGFGNRAFRNVLKKILGWRWEVFMSGGIAERVLVIDDDESIGEEICETLALKKLAAVYAENIQQARAILAKDPALGVVICDYHMPGLNGIEVIETLKKETKRDLAFIMLTGDDAQSTAIQAIRAEVFDFLRKPVVGSAIIKSVRGAFERLAEVKQSETE